MTSTPAGGPSPGEGAVPAEGASPATAAKPARKSLPQPVLATLLVGGSFGGIIAVMIGMLAVLSPSSPAEPDPLPGGRVNVQGAGNIAYLPPTVGPGGPDAPLTAADPAAPPPSPALEPFPPLTLTPKTASAASKRVSAAKKAKGRPTRISIPSIGVSAPVGSIGVDKNGEIEAPPLSKPNLTGWYRFGPAPGDQGPAVILGHVNTRRGAAVFSRVRELKRGNKIAVRRADGKTAIFTVDGVEQVSKLKFPTNRVYSNTATASLRLVTCGGVFNAKAHHYTDNIIVYATLTSTRGK
ncbi:class F sortase [Sphaerimonospora mesophila]|uniref:class F sortase n=1 Tax=Sphaerimonospora mesophila TaxID=37483 RepID=UPI0009FB2FBE